MLKGTRAKLALCPREDEAGLGTSSLGFVKWNKENAGQWKVLGLPGKVFTPTPQQRLGAAEGTFCRKDGGGWGWGTDGYLKTQQYASWKVQEDGPDLHIGSVNLYSPSWRNPLALGECCERGLVCGCSCNFSAQ